MQSIGRYQNRASTKTKRSELRKNQTKAERILWKHIKRNQLGVKFRRQFNIGYYIVDFYCHELKFVIELDGWVHGEEAQRIHDRRRDAYLVKQGFTIVRYRNEQIRYELQNVIQDIINRIIKLQSR